MSLIVRRKAGENIVISGGITIQVLEVAGRRVKLGISAPPDVAIVREELLEKGCKREQVSQHTNWSGWHPFFESQGGEPLSRASVDAKGQAHR
jgi:carbon storage regulator